MYASSACGCVALVGATTTPMPVAAHRRSASAPQAACPCGRSRRPLRRCSQGGRGRRGPEPACPAGRSCRLDGTSGSGSRRCATARDTSPSEAADRTAPADRRHERRRRTLLLGRLRRGERRSLAFVVVVVGSTANATPSSATDKATSTTLTITSVQDESRSRRAFPSETSAQSNLALVTTPARAPTTGRPQDPARDHRHRVVLSEDDRVMAEARVPDARPLVDLTPRDRVVGTHQVAPVADERVRLEVVRGLVQRLQHVHRAAGLALKL